MIDIDTDEVRRRYADGESLRKIATDLGVAVDTVTRRVPEEERRRPGRPSRADVDTAEIVRLHDEEGMSLRQVAGVLGIDQSTAARRYKGR